ncbi:MAG: peptidoglycan editing factor PgeF [Candidatus Dactylopiibacterium sp.]|nr:peptidoglycan editing factor PgeF [Candidatus Dactylopiibacterium sp.]
MSGTAAPTPITPDWPAPARVRAYSTTRAGGVSTGAHAGLNLATHVGDDPAAVAANRQRLARHAGVTPCWLEQVHGVDVAAAMPGDAEPCADASFTRTPGRACVVMTADCLPVLLCDVAGRVVAAAHAGWRGLAGGVLENTLDAMGEAPENLLAWLGPAISQPAFEVGEEVRTAFVRHLAEAEAAFAPGRAAGKWQADLYLLARQRLAARGVRHISGGGRCTFSEAEHFFSARRDGTRSGRQASLIWLA